LRDEGYASVVNQDVNAAVARHDIGDAGTDSCHIRDVERSEAGAQTIDTQLLCGLGARCNVDVGEHDVRAEFSDTSRARQPGAAQDQRALEDWSAVRGLFNLAPDLLHFGGLLLASHPAPVRDAIDAHRRGFDANPVDYLHQNQGRFEAAVLRAAGAYLGVAPGDIALTDSTTMGLGLLYNGLDVRGDQEILTTAHDFYATHEALRLNAQRSGASIRSV